MAERRNSLELWRGEWEMAAEVARNGHLMHEKAQKFLAECADITRGDGFKKSQEFLDECLRQSTGSGLNHDQSGRGGGLVG